MGDERRHGTVNSAKSGKCNCDYFTKSTYTIRQDPPLYVREGSHRILIKYDDDKVSNNVYAYDVDFSVIEDSTGILGCFATYEEAAETKRKESQREKVQNESLTAEKQMAASYIHEIKNPIFSIRGFLQILHQSFSEDDKRKEYVNIIISELDRMNSLINEFLSKYKDDSFINGEDKGGTSVKKTIEEVVAFFQYGFKLKDITCKCDLSSDELVIMVDKEQLIQILINLIQNSIEAMKTGANLSIKAYAKDKTTCIVEIKDEGIGIRQDDIDKIFNPFFSTKENGTGLGLYITKKIINNYGGSIYLESTEGKGTTFYLEFPLISC
ncbi:Histidine kinase [Tepidanaerobacter acetatoxydans Re1]|uniref:histidine kinase n=1 Tax=Tepidanaerobacter acetatoxydans (strain DSM 21804 / JCM 16047 / Re1) TaxID=1209989 RepID=F4LTI7_TEPAE|nr:ATP-binding protein [Tepidanaerobacter acetatoxydans]AEE90518.1 histidine kinase [Tepidanaerobacter acetatoxydans Re1]CCP25028.1 Histidine kinase [Tepidanaerobacter acetatoxydans Re1]